MQANADGIRKEFLAKKREWTEPNRAGLDVLATALAHQAIDLTGIMPLRLKPSSWGPQRAQLQTPLHSQAERGKKGRRSRIKDSG